MSDEPNVNEHSSKAPTTTTASSAQPQESSIAWIQALQLTAEGRKEVVDHIYAIPLSDSMHHSVTEHTLVVDKYLLALMANDPALVELNVEHSFCTDVAVVALTDAMMCNSVLRSLTLSGNPLTDLSAVLLAHALTVNHTLESLVVRDVGFSLHGLKHLATALEHNDSLRILDVDRIVDPEQAQQCGEVLSKIQQLLHLHKYDPKVVASVKHVYRAACCATATQPTAEAGSSAIVVEKLSLKLPYDSQEEAQRREQQQQGDGGGGEDIAFMDHWAFQFAFASLEAAALLQPLAVQREDDANNTPPPCCRVIVIDVDLTGRRCIYDDAIVAMVRCVRNTHQAASHVHVRLGELRLGGTRISSNGIDQLTELLDSEATLLPNRSAAPLLNDVVLRSSDGVDTLSTFPEDSVERLRLGLALRSQPSVVKVAALRLFKDDSTLLHLSLLSTLVTTTASSSELVEESTLPEASSSHQLITDAAVSVLHPLLLRNRYLVSLEISHGDLTDTSAGLLGEFLAFTRTLQVLDLRGNQRLCKRGAARFIAKGLGSNKSIMSLNLSYTGVDTEGGCEIANALLHNRSLTVLDVSKNTSLTSGAVDAFAECVGIVNKVIREIRLTDCGIAAHDVQKLEHQIREAHEPPALRSVLTTLHGIGNGTLASTALTEIRLGVAVGHTDALMRDHSIELLSKALVGCSQVKWLDISGNAVTSEGMRILFQQLCTESSASRLEVLKVSRNPIGNVLEFSEACVELLKHHPYLTTLELKSMNLRSVGVQPILDALLEEHFPTNILHIDCGDNHCAEWQTTVIDLLLKSHSLGASLRTFLKLLWQAIYHTSYTPSTPQQLSFVNAKGVCRNRMSSLQFVELCCELLMLCTAGCRKLNFSNNLLEDDSVRVMATYLGAGMRVVSIDLRDNHITNQSLDVLMVQVLRSDTIHEIRVTGNAAVSVEAEKALKEALTITTQPKFLKNALLQLCDPRGGNEQAGSDEGGDNDHNHVLDASKQQNDHLTDERFDMLLDALCTNGASRMTSCTVANNHVGNKSLEKILRFATSGDERQRHVVQHLVHISFRNTMIQGHHVGALAAQILIALPNLTSLDLSSNELCDTPAKMTAFAQHSLPPLLSALEALDHVLSVHLEDCGLPISITEPILQVLELNNSGLKSVMRSLTSFDATLVSLSLCDTGLTERNLTVLLKTLSHHPIVQDLDLSGNDIGGEVATRILQWCHRVVPPVPLKPASPHRRSIAGGSSTSSGIFRMSLSGSVAGGGGTNAASAAAAPAPSSCRLRTLLLDRNHLGDHHAELLYDMLLHSQTLACVSVLDNELTPTVIFHKFVSSRQLFTENQVLTALHLDAKGIDVFEHERFSQRFVLNLPQLRYAVKDVLPRIAENASDITELNLAETEGCLCDTVCYELSEVLPYNIHVHTLTLVHGAISDEGLLALCRALTMNRSVTSLDLSHNNAITDIGVSGLFDVLCVNPIIREVRLEGNTQIGAVGIAKLMKALLSNHTVSVVALEPELAGAPKESSDAVDIALMLNRTHPNLKAFLLAEPEMSWTELDVSHSKTKFPGSTFADDACAYLCQQLAENTTVEVLNLSNNDLTFDSCYAISNLLNTNRSVTTLDASYNAFGTGVFHLIKSLQRNDVLTTLSLEGCMASEMYLETIALLVDLNRETSMLKAEALAIMDDPSHHRIFEVTGDECLPFNPTRPTRKKMALDDDAMPVVDRVMKFSSAIQDVRLVHHHITCSGLSWFAQHVAPRHHNILTMNLSHNHLDNDCISVLRSLVEDSLKQLRSFDISHNRLSEACIPSLIEMMEVCPTVEVCNIAGHDDSISAASRERIVFLELMNRIASEDARKQFIRASHHDPTLTTFDLSEYRADGRWRLNEHYMTLLAYVIPTNKHIRSLRMVDSAIDDDLLNVFCQRVLSKIQAQRNIGVADAPPVTTENFSDGSGLVELCLSENVLEDISVLVDAIINAAPHDEDEEDQAKYNSPENQEKRRRAVLTFEKLQLDNNKMILKSARYLAALMRQSSSLVELSVADNAWGRTGGVLIQSALCNSESILRISMEGPGIPNSIVEAARCSVESNAQHQGQAAITSAA
ncbi:leucine-rich repeat protein, putative [Bodo saltans]|uniref:Leucine-rich repeat protein, putative n=1 Tax=Bodo saltans TaxID=75058 RepID=A0A0S4JVG5_BODSA|nr:leucine-rich repeat protein, putative [Bodo saltans]|eukprot:CUG94237.1 leucine-rich repeat protein, putative [Bodo saltans]